VTSDLLELPLRELSPTEVPVCAWRLVEHDELETAFDGTGVARVGGRWNSKGVRVVYLSSSLALAALELLAQLDGDELDRPLAAIPVVLDPAPMLCVDVDVLPPGWDAPDGTLHTRFVGDSWVRRQPSAVLAVPSRLVPVERNYLLNPAHPAAGVVTIGEVRPFRFAPDLLRHGAASALSPPPGTPPAEGRAR
jgi:RES domain-containing protein